MVKEIKIADFDYNLPDSFIPRYPLKDRDKCRLLLSAPDGRIYDRKFYELPDLLPSGSLLVCNDTKVINARLTFRKETGSRIEIFLLEPLSPADYQQNFQSERECTWTCLVGNLKKWKSGSLNLEISKGDISTVLTASRITDTNGESIAVKFSWDNPAFSFAEIIEAAGYIPIPPYLQRESEPSDNEDYQTVYAHPQGSVAAPTAGLHFTHDVFDSLKAHNIIVEKLTLHVGAGTFRPVKSESIGEHAMHTERFTVTRHLVEQIIAKRKEKAPVIAVGTTTVRTLESLPLLSYNISRRGVFETGQWDAYGDDFLTRDTDSLLTELLEYMREEKLDSISASTSIMIAPGFRWRIVDGMVTNFHQPQSTLLLLVSSFLDNNSSDSQWRKLYNHALDYQYRFLSYGDASLLFHTKYPG